MIYLHLIYVPVHCSLFYLLFPLFCCCLIKDHFSPIDNSFVAAIQNGIRTFSTWKYWAKYFDVGLHRAFGDQRILCLLQNSAAKFLLREPCPSIIILLLLWYNILLPLQFLMKTLLTELNFFWIKFIVCLGVTGSSDGYSVQHMSAFCSLYCPQRAQESGSDRVQSRPAST